jgi:hypothetical protein
MPQFGASLTDDARVVIYNSCMFIIEATVDTKLFLVRVFMLITARLAFFIQIFENNARAKSEWLKGQWESYLLTAQNRKLRHKKFCVTRP